MSVYFVSRHPGARDWAAAEDIAVDEFITHLDMARVRGDDVVIGSLPVNLAAEVCARGARYLHLSLDLPAEARGIQLTADTMRRYGARVEEYRVERVAIALRLDE
ncbi:MAG: CRISPR-associated protein Csx16 [Sulfuricaulis sp.]